MALRSTHGIDVHVTFRALPFTPPVKLYLLNQEEALIGYYMLTRREEEWGSQTLDMYDVLGSQSLLFSFMRAGGSAGRGVREGIPEVVRRPLGNHHDGPDTLLVTSDTTQTGAVTFETENDPHELRNLIRRARVVLWDFDGPICRLFAGHSAERVAGDLVSWLEGRGLNGLLSESERESLDPQVVLRAVDRRHPGSDLVADVEERLTQEELLAASSAMPTAYADPLIRTWTAVGAGLAITTNNSPRVVSEYLASRGLVRLLRTPHLRPHPGTPPPEAGPALPQPGAERDGCRSVRRPDDRRYALRPRGGGTGGGAVSGLRAQ